MMKKIICAAIVCISLLSLTSVGVFSSVSVDDSIASAILIEAHTGKVLYEKDADAKHIPASVTKVMTMLLIMEAIEAGTLSYDDMVTASANAASMGGSQVYLKEGEAFSVTDMLKSITMASANDACVAMAEHIAGSEDAFVNMMNDKAKALGMVNTNFENTNGLDDTVTNHYTSARDISIMSRELINRFPEILDYTSVWMDSVRDGAFGLTNTNRLVRFYKGANGLKTGSTSKAGFCISASAKRDDMQLIAVIMKAPSRDIRNEAAKKLFDYGFASYGITSFDEECIEDQHVRCGDKDHVDFYIPEYTDVFDKADISSVKREVVLNEDIKAPLSNGDAVGKVTYSVGDRVIHEDDITVSGDVHKITYFGIILRLMRSFITV
ncbi:MAG: D-alanyl-D-alanine carboxypeptidase [Clostridia bacterium]|nr:D-alanyl-D-alanine carboxypeptidase [Clostridia bacterium]